MPNRALIIGVKHPPGMQNLPAVEFDVNAIANSLGSSNGSFQRDHIRVLTDQSADRLTIIREVANIFGRAGPEDTIFVYIAGHCGLDASCDYYFFSYDAQRADLSRTAVPLATIKSMFDQSKCERILLCLDFCHSGGILAARKPDAQENASAVVNRTLRIAEGRGKVIMCGCTAEQSAYEGSDHGHFTRCLVEGLQGAASNRKGEVTANSLHDYLDQEMGSPSQSPMFFGEITGRIVLMHSRTPGVTATFLAHMISFFGVFLVFLCCKVLGGITTYLPVSLPFLSGLTYSECLSASLWMLILPLAALHVAMHCTSTTRWMVNASLGDWAHLRYLFSCGGCG